MTSVSLWVLNRNSDLDMWFVYFIGAYGMGMLAYWGKSSSRPWAWTALLLVLGLVSFEVEFRLRIAVALVSAIGLRDHLVVATPTATLVAPLAESERVKELVALVRGRAGEQFT